MRIFRTLSGAFFLLALACMGQTSSSLHLVNSKLIGGSGGWDYLTVDAQARRLYVTHTSKVEVLDADSLTLIGEVMYGDGLHGVAIAENAGHGFATNGHAANVNLFDLKTLVVLKQIPTPQDPDAILYDPASNRVFVMCGDGACTVVIEPGSGALVDTIPLGGGPEFGVADGRGHVFVNIEDKSEVVDIDSKTLKILNRWSIAPGQEPSGLAIDAEHHRLFSVCRNKLMVVSDADKGKVITTLPIGGGVDGCAFDAGSQTAISSNGEGTMTVVREKSPESYEVVETVATQRGARTIAVDPVTHSIYTATAKFGPMSLLNAQSEHPRLPILNNTFTVLKYQR